MTIKQNGGVFGRNPTFNDVTVGGSLTVDDTLNANNVNIDGGAVDGVTIGTNSAVTEAQIDNININGNTISITDTNGNLTLNANGTGSIRSNYDVCLGNTVPNVVSGYATQQGFGWDYSNSQLQVASNLASMELGRTTSGGDGAVLVIRQASNVAAEITVVGNAGYFKPYNGGGIDFSATSGTGTSELFSDYEEGVFTPTYVGSGGNPTVAYLVQSGIYTKVGRLVTFRIVLITTSSSGGSGNLEISGLPFTVVSGQGASMQFSYAFASNVLQAVPGAPNIILYDTYAGTSNAQVQTSALTSAGGTTYLQFIGQYYV
jgi:hypothetical protein